MLKEKVADFEKNFKMLVIGGIQMEQPSEYMMEGVQNQSGVQDSTLLFIHSDPERVLLFLTEPQFPYLGNGITVPSTSQDPRE